MYTSEKRVDGKVSFMAIKVGSSIDGTHIGPSPSIPNKVVSIKIMKAALSPKSNQGVIGLLTDGYHNSKTYQR